MSSRELYRVKLLAAFSAAAAAYAVYCVYHLKQGSCKDNNSIQTTVNNEKWENFLQMGMVPAAVRHWYTYSETETARLGALEGDDPEVINFIRKYKIVPIPPERLRPNYKAKDKTGRNYGDVLLKVFGNTREKFFIECGAFDGMTGSNTFILERQLNWSGMLIEADPNSIELAIGRKRNAYVVPACLSTDTKITLGSFVFGNEMAGKLTDPNSPSGGIVHVQCLPLFSLLLAINRTTIDYFSLDIEGNEMDVLMTIPFDKVDIKVFLIEFHRIRQGKKALEDFMAEKGYINYPSKPSERGAGGWAKADLLFIKKGSGYKETRDDM